MTSLRSVGLLGGMSWQSSLHYYRLLNEMVQQRVGGHTSAPLVLWSADFAEIEALQQAGDWTAAGEILATAAQGLQGCGVQAIALATNTMHVVADEISDRIDVGFIDLIDVVGKAVTDAGLRSVGLLGTGYLMASDLYPARLGALGVDVLLPEEPDRADVHRVIFDELVHGVVSAAARETYLAIIDRLVSRGAEAVVLACTEIGLLLADGDAAVPLLDSTLLHCAALSDFIVCGTHDSGALA